MPVTDFNLTLACLARTGVVYNESRVLSRAVSSHVEHKILLNGSKRVVIR